MTAWADHALAHLGSLDSAAALSSTAATADSTTTTSEAATGTAYIPITIQEDTEPSIQATVNGSDTSLLVDTGSGGLVIPWQDLGSSHWEVLRELHRPATTWKRLATAATAVGSNTPIASTTV